VTFTDVFVKRPVLALVISLLLVLLGVLGFVKLPVRETPQVDNPIVTVTTIWPSADPAIVESDVTEVLERQLNGIEGVRTITSTSQDGRSEIQVEFDLRRDLEAAANDVRSMVSRARKDLPEEIDEPVVEKTDALGASVLFMRLSGEGKDLLELTEVADTLVRERIENVPGVASVQLLGARTYAMRIVLDSVRMAARQVTVADVEAAVQAGNVDVPAGRVEGTSTQLTLHLEGGLRSPDEFGSLVVKSDGATKVLLRDVAEIRLGAENERAAARADGVPMIGLTADPLANANIVETSDEIQRRLPDIEAALPAGMTLDVVYDRAQSVRTSIHDVERTLFVAFSLVVLVIFLFLRDARSTLVPAVAIPVSIVGTFLFVWAMGFTINVFTLFGLVLAIGLVVDDAIVVLENIVRRIEEGESAFDAAILGTRQIAPPVIVTTLSLVAVFVPVIFTGGATGRLFLEFGVTVAVSVLLSMIVALTLTPMLSSRLLRASEKHEASEGRLKQTFDRSLQWVMARPWSTVVILGVAALIGGAGVKLTPVEFFPIEDRNFFIVQTLAQEGATFDWMDARMKEVEDMLMPLVPERRTMMARVALGRGGVVGQTNSGMIMFPLVPQDERDRSQQEIVDAVRKSLSQVTAFRATPVQMPTVGRGFNQPVQLVLQNSDFEALAKELPIFLKAARELPGLASVNEDLKLDRPELRLAIDRDKAASLGVKVKDVARTLEVLTGGIEISRFKRGVRQYSVLAELARSQRDDPADVTGIYIRAEDGRMVPLSNLVHGREGTGPATRYHYDRSPSATVSANLDGISMGEGIDRLQQLADDTLPPGFRTALAGQSKDFAEGTSALAQLFFLSLLFVFLLLAAQFDSFLAPISILLAVPLALAGAFAALMITGSTLSFFAQVGLILLVGLVTKNGILIVEYAQQVEKSEGLSPWQAAEKATLLRFRPILMTSVATIGGAIPISLGLSGSSRNGLGIAVVGGMITATALSLYVTPVVYAALASLRLRRRSVEAVAKLALGALVLGHAATARAEPLTLGKALAIALDQNIDIRTAEAYLTSAEAFHDVVRAGVLPSATVDGIAYTRNDAATTPDSSPTGAQAYAELDVPLLALANLSSTRAAHFDELAARSNRDVAVEGSLASVASRFVSLQQSREAVVAAQAQYDSAKRLADLASSRVEVGAAPVIDRTRAQLELKGAEARRLAAQTTEYGAGLDLANELGVEIDDAIDVVAAVPLVEPEALPTDAALEAALASAQDDRPEIVAARARLASIDAQRRAKTFEYAPTFGAYGKAGAYTDLQGTEVAPLLEAGLVASIPLFEGGARAAGARQLRAIGEAEALALATAERDVEVGVRLALRRVRDQAVNLDVARDAAALAAEELERAEALYRAGTGDNLAVTQAQASVADAERARVDALAGYNLAVVDWYVARGQLHTLASR
jgi:multidrug efflux pump